jgi:hypothetical protein
MDRIVFLVVAAAAVSCVPIDGGAVEASWVVRTDDGRAITDCSCSDPLITTVRLSLVGVSEDVKGTEPCKDRVKCGFACQRHTGATPFDIPPGLYLISVIPADAVGHDLTQSEPPRPLVNVPAPVLREVVRGQPTQMDALAIVAGCSPACSANKNRVCSRQ